MFHRASLFVILVCILCHIVVASPVPVGMALAQARETGSYPTSLQAAGSTPEASFLVSSAEDTTHPSSEEPSSLANWPVLLPENIPANCKECNVDTVNASCYTPSSLRPHCTKASSMNPRFRMLDTLNDELEGGHNRWSP
ncbi:hypothetical protein BJ912DRAFT_1061899 [Pholiota molesta]|nr:hypothetical protein BJ912DRAFT_1061899 [Pholiota molesta]